MSRKSRPPEGGPSLNSPNSLEPGSDVRARVLGPRDSDLIFDNRPDNLPLLSVLGARSVFFEGARSLVHSAPLPEFPEFHSQLEELETRLARGRGSASELRRPAFDARSARFLRFCLERGQTRGGLRLHTLFGSDPPLETLITGDLDAAEFPLILRLHSPEFDSTRHVMGPDTSESPAPIRALVYHNPLGDPPLPHAAREAETAAEILEGVSELKFVARGLGGGELSELLAEADIVYYTGHGKHIAHHPAVPAPEGWTPFQAAGQAAGARSSDASDRRIIIFSACLENVSRSLNFAGVRAAAPVCRLADRPSEFGLDLLRAWTTSRNWFSAWRRALQLDLERGDIRRFVFRLQC